MGIRSSKRPKIESISENCLTVGGRVYYSEHYINSINKSQRQQFEEFKSQLNDIKLKLSCKELELSKLKAKEPVVPQEINEDCILVNSQIYYTENYLRVNLLGKQKQHEEMQSNSRNALVDLEKQLAVAKKENLNLKSYAGELENKLRKAEATARQYEANISNICQEYNTKLQQTLLKHEQNEQEYKQKIRALEDTLENRNAQITKLLEQKAQLKVNFENEKFRLEDNCRKLQSIIDKCLQTEKTLTNKSLQALESTVIKQDDYQHKALQTIEEVRKEVALINNKVIQFSGTKADKTYLHLKELLIRSVVTLDNVETNGFSIIRTRRMSVIKFIHDVLEKLNNM